LSLTLIVTPSGISCVSDCFTARFKVGLFYRVPSKAGSILILPADAAPNDAVWAIVLVFDD